MTILVRSPLRVFEQQSKEDGHDEGVGGEDEPARLPTGDGLSSRSASGLREEHVVVDDLLRHDGADESTQAVGHHHE